MPARVRVLILGAGPTGILTAWALKERGITDVCIIEKTDRPGGLARSREAAGWHVDFGPHRFQTRDERVRDVIEHVLGTRLRTVTDKRIGVWLNELAIDYPPALGPLGRALGARELARCGASFLKSRLILPKADPAHTYEDWVIARYGNRFYRTTLAPMARKMWALEPPALSEDLAAERVVLGSARGLRPGVPERHRYEQFQESFYYPETYFGEIWENGVVALERSGVSLVLNATPSSLRVDDNRIVSVVVRTAGDEQEFAPDYVVSTIPLPDLVSMFGAQVPGDAHVALERILYRALVIVYVVLRKPRVSPFHFIYFPQPEYVFQRLFEQKNFAEQSHKKDKTVVGAEISCFVDDLVWRAPDEELFGKVVAGLEEAGLASSNETLGFFVARESHGYPMYMWNYRGGLETVLDELSRIENVVLNGRQGLFKFNNVDHCVAMGAAAAEHIAAQRGAQSWLEAIRRFKAFRVID